MMPRSSFKGGPYDGVVLHFKEQPEVMILPITITPTIPCDRPPAQGEVRYHLVGQDDYECRYEFDAVRV